MNRILSWFLIALMLSMSGPLQALSLAARPGFRVDRQFRQNLGFPVKWVQPHGPDHRSGSRARKTENASTQPVVPQTRSVAVFFVAQSSLIIWNYYMTDGLGSVLGIIDNNGNQKARYDYQDYGSLLSSDGPLADENVFRYTGEQFDPETGFYYLRNRYYQPEFGRFLQRDPIRYAGGSNMMSYCAGDPVNRTDRSGLLLDDDNSWVGMTGEDRADARQARADTGVFVAEQVAFYYVGGWAFKGAGWALRPMLRPFARGLSALGASAKGAIVEEMRALAPQVTRAGPEGHVPISGVNCH